MIAIKPSSKEKEGAGENESTIYTNWFKYTVNKFRKVQIGTVERL